MALKFLNKKGWHTGSLRNIENVWKAEQKHEAEQKKLEELRKQIQEERERDEFRLLQEQAGILPRQERLEFLYDSGLAVGKGSTEGVVFKALDKPNEAASSSASSAPASASGTPGALFEEKPHSVNDAWRKLHSDPLLLIRQREQDALARIKNNPVQMAMIRKSVLAKNKDKDNGEKEREKKHHKHSSKRKKRSSSSEPADSDDASHKEERARKNSSTGRSSYRPERHRKEQSDSEEDKGGRESRKKYRRNDSKRIEQAYSGSLDAKHGKEHNRDLNRRSEHEKYHSESRSKHDAVRRESRSSNGGGQYSHNTYAESTTESQNKRWKGAPKLSEEARAARLREMQMDAEVHEEQRWKRLKSAEEDDARELKHNASSRGRNFLDAAHRSVYGAEKGGSSTIEESVRRRTYYSQGRSEGGESNAFRR